MMRFWDILQWTVVAAIIVVLATNANGVATAITSFGTFWTRETAILASGGKYAPQA